MALVVAQHFVVGKWGTHPTPSKNRKTEEWTTKERLKRKLGKWPSIVVTIPLPSGSSGPHSLVVHVEEDPEEHIGSTIGKEDNVLEHATVYTIKDGGKNHKPIDDLSTKMN